MLYKTYCAMFYCLASGYYRLEHITQQKRNRNDNSVFHLHNTLVIF